MSGVSGTDGRSVPELPEDEGAVLESGGSPAGTSWNAFATYGDEDGDPVVLSHPTPGSREFGRLLADAAASVGVRLVVPQRPRYGNAGSWGSVGRILAGLGSGDLSSLSSPIWATVDELDLESVGILGFSSGCPFALSLAKEAPDRIEEVVLVGTSTPPGMPGATVPFERSIPEVAPLAYNGDRIDGSDPLLDRLLSVTGRGLGRTRPIDWLEANLEDLYDAEVVSLYGEPDRVDGVAPTLRRDLAVALASGTTGYATERWLLTRGWESFLGTVERPVTLLHGTADPYAPPEAGRTLGRRIEDATLGTVPERGHLSTLLSAAETALRHAAPSLTPRDSPVE